MDEGTVGFLTFLAMSGAVSIVAHYRARSFERAVLISGPAAALLFQIVAAIHIGYVDPFFLIALFTTSLLGWIVAYVVGYALRRLRKGPYSTADQR